MIFTVYLVKVLMFDIFKNHNYFLHPLLFTVAQECSKQAAIQVVQDGDKEVFIELKC